MKKEEIRFSIRALREKQSPRTKKIKDKKIEQRVIKLALFESAKCVFLYISNEQEVSTDFIIENYLQKKRLIVPKVRGGEMQFYELKAPVVFKTGTFGIREPINAKPFRDLQELDLAFVPAVAFDERGHRVGFGGGYFDKFLPKIRCTTIGLAYELQMVDKIPEAKYDVPVSYILTEKRLMRPLQNMVS